MTLLLPTMPMSPIASPDMPMGDDWGYQLKWDGVRILAAVENGSVRLFSKKMLSKNTVFPEIVRLFQNRDDRLLLDGEAVVFDTQEQRPEFAKALQRERAGGPGRAGESAVSRYRLCYVLFDLLHAGDRDLRDTPYAKRHEQLLSLFPAKTADLFVTDLISDGRALWQWVEERKWEGVVSKRLSSLYREGKKHADWYKKKTALRLSVDIVGITEREGRVASLVMSLDGLYFGRVSLGLNERTKLKLREIAADRAVPEAPWRPLPADIVKERVMWIAPPLRCDVTGLEITSAGLLRHPKIARLGL